MFFVRDSEQATYKTRAHALDRFQKTKGSYWGPIGIPLDYIKALGTPNIWPKVANIWARRSP